MQTSAAVEIVILAGIEDVESAYPERDRRRKKKNARIERAANRDPRRGGRDTQCKSEYQVRPSRHALGIGVEQQHSQRDRREQQRQSIQLARSQHKHRARNHDERHYECWRKMTGRQGARAGAGIGCIDCGIRPAVKSHGSGSRSDHCDNDPEKLVKWGPTAGSEHRSTQRKRKREDGVLPLDHLQRDAQVVQHRHESIVMQRRRPF